MKLIIKNDYNEMCAWAAQHIAHAINNHKEDRPFVLGLPQLAMHSCYETVGVQDARYLETAIQSCYSSPLQILCDGSCVLR